MPHHIGNLASLFNAFRYLRSRSFFSNNSSVAWHLLECLLILIMVSGNLIKASGVVWGIVVEAAHKIYWI